MNIKSIIIIFIISILIFQVNAISQANKHDFEKWPGKNSVPKTNVEISDNLVLTYNMELAKGYSDSTLFYKIPLQETDDLKRGNLQIKIFSSSSGAQLALAEYLNWIVTPGLLTRLTNEKFRHGDVVFGSEQNGIIQMAFTRNNVLVIIHAPADKALFISNEIDLIIQNAPELRSSINPSLLFTR